jgi:N-methylhydantoinase A
MVGAIEDLTIRRGVDPRDYLLIAGGSAAGLHAAAIARELGMKRTLIPNVAGVLSAYGIATGDIRFGFARGLFTSSDQFDHERVNAILTDLRNEGTDYLARMRVPPDRRTLHFTTEARYAGQVWQLTLPLPRTPITPGHGLVELVEAFHRLHEHHYTVRASDPVEFTEWNVLATGRMAADASNMTATRHDQRPSRRRVFLKDAGGHVEIPVHAATSLIPNETIHGPALIESQLTVALVPLNTKAHITSDGGLMIALG